LYLRCRTRDVVLVLLVKLEFNRDEMKSDYKILTIMECPSPRFGCLKSATDQIVRRRCETKTKDNVFVKMQVTVQYQVFSSSNLKCLHALQICNGTSGSFGSRSYLLGRGIHHGVKMCFVIQVLRESVYDAFYRLTNAHSQITAYVFDVVRCSPNPISSLTQP